MLIDFTDSDNVVKTAVALGREGDLSQATRQEIDEILYWFQQPYNSYCASGFPMHFGDRAYMAGWSRRRDYITDLWNKAQEPVRLRQQARWGVRALAAALEASQHVVCNFNARVWAVSDGR